MKTMPLSFKPLFWSYDFDRIDPVADAALIIRQTINYGTLEQWRFLKQYYGEKKIQEIAATLNSSALRPPALRLASIMFNINAFRHAPGGNPRS